MSKITAIEPQKRTGRVNIYIDNEFAVGIDEKLLIDFDLYKNKEINGRELDRLRNGVKDSQCLEYAYRLLTFRPRSIDEMEKKLLEKFEPNTVKTVVKKLIKYNYLNDKDFATMWVRERSVGRGRKALYFELMRKGISKEIAEDALNEITSETELETAIRLIKSKEKYKNLDHKSAYTKIGGFLARRGFSYEIIKKVINEVN